MGETEHEYQEKREHAIKIQVSCQQLEYTASEIESRKNRGQVSGEKKRKSRHKLKEADEEVCKHERRCSRERIAEWKRRRAELRQTH